MTDERAVDEIVTKFLLNTCRLQPKPNIHAVNAELCAAWIAGERYENHEESEFIPLTTGSVAEFYIEPTLPCFGDVDIMFYANTTLAMPAGQKPPLNLPDKFHNSVKVVEIINSQYLGYVYLKLQYLLIKRSDCGEYTAVENDKRHYLANHGNIDSEREIHGPALVFTFRRMKIPLSVDVVRCVRCLVWPPQAADWPTRQRNYGWPDSTIVDLVVSNGCDVVGVAHRLCKQDEWMSKCQWRLSFSRAEIVLLNSWMPIQQIVYHLLRVYAKTEHLTDSTNNLEAQKLNNYHIKTLMLWACELKSKNWWTDDLNLVRICVEMMHILAVWLADTQYPHYFIYSCNLIDNSFDTKTTTSQLMSLDNKWMSAWILNKYVRKCSQLYSDNITLLLDDANTSVKLQNAVSVLVDRRLNSALYEKWIVYLTAELNITCNLSHCLSSVQSCANLVTELSKVDARCCFYFSAVAFLQLAHAISRNDFDFKLLDTLAAVVGQSVDTRRCSKQISSTLAVRKAAKLMKVVANNSLSTLELIEIELSKAYLQGALKCNDSDSDSVYCLANVYLAVLYYTTGQYQKAINHCTLVMRSQDHSQNSSNVVKGELLPKIDDDIDTVLGLTVIYHYLQLDQQQKQRVSGFTTEVFAYYLHSKCMSARKWHYSARMFSADTILPLVKCIAGAHPLVIGDALVLKSVDKFYCKSVEHTSKHSTTNSTEPNPSGLVELLQKCGVERLTTLRQLAAREFGSVATIVTTDFEALYAYKRGDYQRCLHLSEQNVHTLLPAVRRQNVLIFPPFIHLLDDSVVSIISLALIVKLKFREDYTISSISQLNLSLYLMAQCRLELCPSIVSLNQTLFYVKVTRRRHALEWSLDQLILKLIERRVHQYFEFNLLKSTS